MWFRTMLQTRIDVYKSAITHVSPNSKSIGYQLIDAIVARDVGASRQAARDMTRSILTHLGIQPTF